MKFLGDSSKYVTQTLKKEFLGDSPVKFKKQSPEIIKSNAYHLVKSFCDFDLREELLAKRKQSIIATAGFFESKLTTSPTLGPISTKDLNNPIILKLDKSL